MPNNVTEPLEFVLAVLQLGLLFESIVSMCPQVAKRYITGITRSNGAVVRLNPCSAVKDFTRVNTSDGDAMIDTRQLQQMYNLLRNYEVPYVDYLDRMSACGLKLIFRPRGLDRASRSVGELILAIDCEVTALVVLHQHDLMLRDIRWSNDSAVVFH